MKMNLHKIYLLLALPFFFSSCNEREETYQKVGVVFDTICSIQIFTKDNETKANSILEKAFEKLQDLELTFSPTLKHSQLCKLNESKINISFNTSSELYYLIEESLKIAKITNGAFNPCIGFLTKLWRPLWSGDIENQKLPSSKLINEALKCIDYNSLILKNKTITKKEEVSIDLGAIAKGYATDCIKKLLEEEGIKRAIIDLGGNILAMKKKGNGDKWKVGIKTPLRNNNGEVAGYVEVEDMAVVTSGNYERFFEKDGRLYHHIISSETGYPLDNELNAVSIISKSAMLSDALSTSCYVLGLEKSKELLKNFPESSGIFFLKTNEIVQVNMQGNKFTLLDESLKLKY